MGIHSKAEAESTATLKRLVGVVRELVEGHKVLMEGHKVLMEGHKALMESNSHLMANSKALTKSHLRIVAWEVIAWVVGVHSKTKQGHPVLKTRPYQFFVESEKALKFATHARMTYSAFLPLV